ncbi:MAG TPA: hypothetical protein PLE30_00335 [Candidatus Kapabacteria bacterium]|nr:hypothetical protein [Candidatus Kapabacteria bacterium]
MTNKQYKRKKRIIEIYFVLYLAALILLIPSHKEEISNSNNSNILQIPFSIKLEKQSLSALYFIDSVGIKIRYIDSINNIYYTGNVKDVEYKFTIEDLQSKQNVSLDNIGDTLYQVFSFNYLDSGKSVRFTWRPNNLSRLGKNFIVTVIASAISLDSVTYGKVVEDKIKFNINLNYDHSSSMQLISTNIDTTTMLKKDEVINPIIQSIGKVLLLPREETIQTIAYSDWENEISLFGINPETDLRSQPTLIISRQPNDKIGGNAKIAGYRNNAIIIKGEAPGYGTMTVKLKLIRHSDGLEAIKEFKVIPQLLDEPEIPAKLFPLITYRINPKMPITSDRNAYSILANNEGKMIARSQNSAEIVFTPQITDTGKTFVLERYLSDNLFGQKYFIKVSSFPKPEIYRMSELSLNQIRIYTNSYGHFNNAPNYIKYIELIEGNAKIREIIGAQQAPDNKNLLYKQVFEIIPKDPSKPFNFKIRAVAENSMKSEVVVYPKQ